MEANIIEKYQHAIKFLGGNWEWIYKYLVVNPYSNVPHQQGMVECLRELLFDRNWTGPNAERQLQVRRKYIKRCTHGSDCKFLSDEVPKSCTFYHSDEELKGYPSQKAQEIWSAREVFNYHLTLKPAS